MKKLYVVLAIAFVIVLIIQFPHATINAGDLAQAHQKLKNDCMSCHKPFSGTANEKCISCHSLKDIGNNKEGKQSKAQFHQQLANQKCSSCHNEHQGKIPEHGLTAFNHELLSISIINNCVSCHIKPTDNLHTQVVATCKSCHETKNWKGSTTFNHEMLLNKSNCASCHQKPQDKFHSIIKDNCNKCHNTSKWKPSTFDHSAYFTLDQNHNVTCNTCHSKNNYNSYSCYGCHEHSESHNIAEHSEEGISNISSCTSCHKSANEHDIINNNKIMKEKESNKMKEFFKSTKNKKDEDH